MSECIINDPTVPGVTEPNDLGGLRIQGIEDQENRLIGTSASDLIVLGDFGDHAQGRAGDDTIVGLDGDDCITGDGGDDRVLAGKGSDTVSGGDGDDILYGGKNDDVLRGDEGDDRVFGNSGSDTLQGHPGDDTLYGGKDDDVIDGDDGKDLILGDQGDDCLTGGQGEDTFRFEYFGETAPTASAANSNPLGVDTLTDFTPSEDTIQMDQRMFPAIATGELSEGAFEIVSDFDPNTSGTSTAKIIYDSSSGLVYYNPGEEVGDEVTLMQLPTGLELQPENFEFF